MKIAVCLSGEPRMYRECAPAIKYFFSECDVDFFIHSWNKNHWYSSMAEKDQDFCDKGLSKITSEFIEFVDSDELSNDLVELYNPKKIFIQSPKIFFANVLQSQQFSMFAANSYKTQYEVENGFLYDLVVKCRHDLIWAPGIKFSTERFRNRNTIYTTYVDTDSSESSKYPMCLDRFFCGSSGAMNIATNVFNESSYNIATRDISIDWMLNQPERLLYDYITRRGLQVSQHGFHETIVRLQSKGLHYSKDFLQILDNSLNFFKQ